MGEFISPSPDSKLCERGLARNRNQNKKEKGKDMEKMNETESALPKTILDLVLRNNWRYEGFRESDLIFRLNAPRHLVDEQDLYSGEIFILVSLAPYLRSVKGEDSAPTAHSITISLNRGAPMRFERFLFLPADANASRRIGYLFCRAEEYALGIFRFKKEEEAL
jgi:hypothetical protein